MGSACPAFADVFVGREAAQGLEAACIVVGIEEVVEVRREPGVAIVVV